MLMRPCDLLALELLEALKSEGVSSPNPVYY
jgi:hypothetical protein